MHLDRLDHDYCRNMSQFEHMEVRGPQRVAITKVNGKVVACVGVMLPLQDKQVSSIPAQQTRKRPASPVCRSQAPNPHTPKKPRLAVSEPERPTRYKLSPSFNFDDVRDDLEDEGQLHIDMCDMRARDCSSVEPMAVTPPGLQQAISKPSPSPCELQSPPRTPEKPYFNVLTVPSPQLGSPLGCHQGQYLPPASHGLLQVPVYSPTSGCYFYHSVLHPHIAELLPKRPMPSPPCAVSLLPQFQSYGPFAPASVGPLVTISQFTPPSRPVPSATAAEHFLEPVFGQQVSANSQHGQ